MSLSTQDTKNGSRDMFFGVTQVKGDQNSYYILSIDSLYSQSFWITILTQRKSAYTISG